MADNRKSLVKSAASLPGRLMRRGFLRLLLTFKENPQLTHRARSLIGRSPRLAAYARVLISRATARRAPDVRDTPTRDAEIVYDALRDASARRSQTS